jgi:hypothetical protein
VVINEPLWIQTRAEELLGIHLTPFPCVARPTLSRPIVADTNAGDHNAHTEFAGVMRLY